MIKHELIEGDWIECIYPSSVDGRPVKRRGEVVEVPDGDSILVKTADGYRRFKYGKMTQVKLTQGAM
jgi:hypothetical protein